MFIELSLDRKLPVGNKTTSSDDNSDVKHFYVKVYKLLKYELNLYHSYLRKKNIVSFHEYFSIYVYVLSIFERVFQRVLIVEAKRSSSLLDDTFSSK